MTLHFVTIIAIIREEHFSDATTMGRYLYTLVQPTPVLCAHTHTRSTSKFFRIARIPSEILFLSSNLEFYCVFWHEVSCGHRNDAAPLLTLKRTDLIRTSFSSSLRKYRILQLLPHSRFLLFVGFVAIVSDRTEYRVTGTRRYGINRFSSFFFFFSKIEFSSCERSWRWKIDRDDLLYPRQPVDS